MEIIEYKNANNMIVKFDNGYVTKATFRSFELGEVFNPLDLSVCKAGYVGIGSFKPSHKGVHTPNYECWKDMMRRCYKDERKNITYRDCKVCDEWLNFQNFAKWYDENYYEIKGEKMCLDKDILIKGNKIYSPETCIFVPSKINVLFIKSNKVRGDLPIGVTRSSTKGKYTATCTRYGKACSLGTFNDIYSAFNSYKKEKEKYIKEVADKYKEIIPHKLYDTLYEYEVSFND